MVAVCPKRGLVSRPENLKIKNWKGSHFKANLREQLRAPRQLHVKE